MISLKNIVLIGMPGSGKTTIGKLLSQKMHRDLLDTDEIIENESSMSISAIFSQHGETHFRKLESEVAIKVSELSGKIISTGGGIILNEKNIVSLKKTGFLIFIDRPMDFIFSDIDEETRPLLKGQKKRLFDLYEQRYLLYLKYADYKIVNTMEIEIIVDEICAMIPAITHPDHN